MDITQFQRMVDDIYGARDRARGVPRTFQWFVEEVGELSRAVRKGEAENLHEEFADVLAWLATLASMCNVDLDRAVAAKYPGCCTKCGACPCSCM